MSYTGTYIHLSKCLRGLEVEGAQQEAAEGPATEVYEVHGPLASVHLELGIHLDLEGIPRLNYPSMPFKVMDIAIIMFQITYNI